jgi:hypothetical protein
VLLILICREDISFASIKHWFADTMSTANSLSWQRLGSQTLNDVSNQILTECVMFDFVLKFAKLQMVIRQ